MKGADSVWSLVLLKDGESTEEVALADGATTIGRDSSCTIALRDRSVSRQHAEITCSANQAVVRDLDSRNGVRVNGVPRRQATLQPGDTVEFGACCFRVLAGRRGMVLPSSLADKVREADKEEKTERHRLLLPSQPGDRQAATFCQVCAWLAEELEEEDFRYNCMRVLLDGLRAVEVQFYNARRELEQWVSEDGAKPRIRLATYLAERFQNAPEAICVRGHELRQHQQHIGKFNYLAGPLRPLTAVSGLYPFVFLIRPVDWKEFEIHDRVLLQSICQLWVKTLDRNRRIEELRADNTTLKRQFVLELLGDSKTFNEFRQQTIKVARTNATISIQGETGSGKEVVARFIHAQSHRGSGPYIKVNCAAIPTGLIENELFGHVKGAFADARADRSGKFEQAHGGTLFLDEVGDMPLSVQLKLLRAIESGEIEKLGSETVLQFDVRILAATHHDLAQLVRDRQFREDLYYRLSVLTIRVPPLREHLDDVGILASRFVEEFCAENGMAGLTFEDAAIAELKRHAWPGNVRELRNVVQRCAVASTKIVISSQLVREQIKSLTS